MHICLNMFYLIFPFLERHGSDMSAQQISAADLLPMDTRPSQCTSRKKLQNALFAVNTQQLCNYSSQINQQQNAGHHQELYKQKMSNGSKSNNEICNRANQLNYNLAGTNGLRRCLSSTPVLSSPEPVSSGYCSSTTSNSNTAISNQSVLEQKLISEDKQIIIEKRLNDRDLIKFDSNEMTIKLNKQIIKEDVNREECHLLNENKEMMQSDSSKQLIKYSTPASLIKKPKSSSIKKLDNLINNEKQQSNIPTISSFANQFANQQIKNKIRTPIDSNFKTRRNSFGFIQTPIQNSILTNNNSSKLTIDKKIDQNKQIKLVADQKLNSLSKCNLAASLSSLPTTMLPVLKRSSIQRNKNLTPLSAPSARINRSSRSNSIQNVNVQTLNHHGFNLVKSKLIRPNTSSLYNSSSSLNSVPISRSKNYSKFNFNSIKTCSTNNLDSINQQESTKIVRYPNYLASSQHITNCFENNSDLEHSPSSKSSSDSASNSVSKLRRPSLRAF